MFLQCGGSATDTRPRNPTQVSPCSSSSCTTRCTATTRSASPSRGSTRRAEPRALSRPSANQKPAPPRPAVTGRTPCCLLTGAASAWLTIALATLHVKARCGFSSTATTRERWTDRARSTASPLPYPAAACRYAAPEGIVIQPLFNPHPPHSAMRGHPHCHSTLIQPASTTLGNAWPATHKQGGE